MATGKPISSQMDYMIITSYNLRLREKRGGSEEKCYVTVLAS